MTSSSNYPFPAAAGHGNLPQGNWSPILFSAKVLPFFRTASVISEITTTEWIGDIKGMGSEVEIIKEPVFTTVTYSRGTKLVSQAINDSKTTLVINNGLYTQFEMDDIEAAFSHIGWAGLAQSSAAYSLKNAYDRAILTDMLATATLGNSTTGIGTNATPAEVGFASSDTFTPLNYMARLARILDENDIPEEGRFFLATPAFYEQLAGEDSKLVDVSVTGDPMSLIRQRKLATNRQVHGFTCFKSNNLPTSASGYKVVFAGHTGAYATATAITNSEVIRSVETFGDIYRGLLVYGKGILRPEALFAGVWQ